MWLVTGGFPSIRFVAAPASRSSDDCKTLKALLAEERAENKRLRQIILAMQRYRFGRRAESLP